MRKVKSLNLFHVEHIAPISKFRIGQMVNRRENNVIGSIINVICIIIGTLIGLLLTKIGDKYKETIMQGIALTVTLIGLQMALETNAVIIVLVSIVFGALLGELL